MSDDSLGRRRVEREEADAGSAGAQPRSAADDAAVPAPAEEGADAAGEVPTAAAPQAGATCEEGRGAASDEPPPTGRRRAVAAAAGAGVLAVVWALLVALSEGDVAPATGGEGEPRVRIALLHEVPEVVLGLEGVWRVEPDVGAPLLLEDPGEVTLRALGGGLRGLSLAAASGAGFAGAGSLTLRPLGADPTRPAPPFELAGRRYRGWLTVRLLPSGALAAVNSVGVEDYLAGVIGHEMPISWPDAALEAQAVAARTYALAHLKPEATHDLEADVRSQVYRGVIAEDERARARVAATRGQVVAYDGELVVTYFHSTCGGDTVPARWVFDWVKEDTEPLSGATDCPCQASRLYRWEDEVDLAEQGLDVALPLRAAEVEVWPRGGYVKTLRLTGADGAVLELGHWEARRRLGLRSYAFEAAPAADGAKLRVWGRGWGHGVGMCQFGAAARAREGWDAARILRHYYPGAAVERLEY